jgi:hypothetical protein
MSIEYEAPLARPLTADRAAAAAAAVGAASPYRVCSQAADTFEFALSGAAPAPTHATLTVSPDSLYVAFHSGTRADRAAFLDALRAVLQGEELGGEFEEL